VLYQWFQFETLPISSLWKNTTYFLAFYSSKVAISLFFASFVFLFKRKFFIVALSLLLDVWIMASLIYFRSNNLFLDAFSLSMAGNMNGFWDSIFLYLSIYDWIFVLLTLLLVPFTLTKKDNQRGSFAFLGTLLVAFLLQLLSTFCFMRIRDPKGFSLGLLNPFSRTTMMTVSGVSIDCYISDNSVLHNLIFSTAELVSLKFDSSYDDVSLNEEERQIMNSIIIPNLEKNQPKYPIVLILVESMESWVVNPEIMPNLVNFIENYSVAYFSKIQKQTKYGISMDAQILVNTGILPINEGATSFRFPQTKFPSLVKQYDKSALILPHDELVWNQLYMSKQLGYDTTYICTYSDKELVTNLLDIYKKYDYVQMITCSTHAPFTYYEMDKDYIETLPKEMPQVFKSYLNSFHLLDRELGVFFEQFERDDRLKNSVVVITGDHTIFDRGNRKMLSDGGDKFYHAQNAYVPLIIYSPTIDKKRSEDMFFQMDVYPTIMSEIGCKDYYWKGFGINLLDSIKVRTIDSQQACDLSDKLIKSNFFEKYE